MEAVSVLFYWGGNTLQDPEEGFSYDLPPKGFYNIPRRISLVELESMLLPKVAGSGETGQLRFTCRFPFRNCHNVIKYRPFPINDDESFSTLLQNRSIFLSCPEIYVRNLMEYTSGEEQMMLSPIPLMGINAQPKISKQRTQFLTSTSPGKWSLAAEIVGSIVDLLTKILLRVPAKSLMKFKCVSKHWLYLISDSKFAINHTHHNPTPLVSGIYIHSHWHNTPPLNDQVLPVSVAGHCRNSLPTFSFIDRALSSSTEIVSVTNSSNGLMLCCDGDRNYIVCNLTTQKLIQLPKPSDILSEWWSQYDPYLFFDPSKSPHYKVVLLSSSHHPNASRLAIYASECASWKYVDLIPSIETSGRSAILDGAIIWMSCKDWRGNCSRHEHIYSRLDMDAEKLEVTRVPSDPTLSKYTLYFGECGGRLLLIQLPTHDASEFSILEMDTDGFCWILKDRVDLTSLILPYKVSCVISVISIVKGTKENDLAVVFYNRGKVISYNLECRTMKVICELSPGEITSYARRGLYEYSNQFIESLSPV